MPTATYIPLATLTLSTTDSEVTFANIPNTYRDLILTISGRISNDDLIRLRFNGDSGANYSSVIMFGDGSSATSEAFTTNQIWLYRIGIAANGVGQIQIMDYAQTDKHKTALARVGNAARMTSATAGRWANTAAVTSVSVLPSAGNWESGSTFSLYGIAG